MSLDGESVYELVQDRRESLLSMIHWLCYGHCPILLHRKAGRLLVSLLGLKEEKP